MFADDTSVLQSGSSICDLNTRLNRSASEVSAWANMNKMALNTTKTKSILITTHQKIHFLQDPSLNIIVDGNSIEQVNDAKLLGVTLDCHLTWDKHIKNICSIVKGRLALLRRIKPFLSHNCTLRFYNSCIHNHLIYCSSAWGNCSLSSLTRLLRLQKRAARIILDADFSQSSVSLFSKLKWLPIFHLIKFRKLILLFSIVNNPDVPLCLKQMFNFLSSIRSAGPRTRACAFDLKVPFPRSNSGKRTFAYCAATLFNCLDPDLKQLVSHSPSTISFSSSLTSFKLKLRNLFLQFFHNIDHFEELMCYACRFSLQCNCITR